MYATKRKLHNLLQAATGGTSTSTPGAPASGHGHKHTPSSDSTKSGSRLSTVFRSKSVVNLPGRTADGKGSGPTAVGGTGVGGGAGSNAGGIETLQRPTTAGAVEGGGGAMVVDEDADIVAGSASSTTNTLTLSPAAPDPKKTTPSPTPTNAESWSIRTPNDNSTTTTAFSLSEKPTPAYAPWDRPQFLSRLKTFRFVDKWTAKPAPVNEVVWAKRGWVCVDKNRVRCTVCSREVVVKIETDEAAEADDDDTTMVDMERERLKREGRKRMQQEIVDRYRGMVVIEHEEYCLWRRRGCDDTIYHLPLANPSHSIPSLRARYASLVTVQKDLPSAIDYPTTIIDFSRIAHAVKLVQDPHITPSANPNGPPPLTSNNEIIESAFILALFGWASEEPSIPTLLTCGACFRRLGLWLFQNHKGSVGGGVGGGDGEGEDAMVCRLDVVGEHREYCPWVNKESQGREPGWKTLWKMVVLQMGAMGLEKNAHFQQYQHHQRGESVVSVTMQEPRDPFTDKPSPIPNSPPASSAAQATAASTLTSIARERSLSTPVPGAELTMSDKERVEGSSKLESRLKRLKTVYFGSGSKKGRSGVKGEKDGRARASSLVVGLGRKANGAEET
ncbi:C3HC zinc finger-like-domain-containing protein [Kalaharituber pfeilii]|nr:C3HC zinc finger-like-domain-containing protein [Kalaharituber pfeilii]